MTAYYLKLRANIELESDLQLAERELHALFSEVIALSKTNLSLLTEYSNLPERYVIAHSRTCGAIGFIGIEPKYPLSDIVKQLSFIQEIWCVAGQIDEHIRTMPFVQTVDSWTCVVPLLAMSELLTYIDTTNPNENTVKNIVGVLTLIVDSPNISRLIEHRNTSTPHVHGLHTYKAKFFPRFIRSLLVAETSPDDRKQQTILDPFVGSGTTLIEASLLGFQSIGIDIDKLACLISESKIQVLNTPFEALQHSALQFCGHAANANERYEFPSWIRKKFERGKNEDEQAEYEQEISRWIGKLQSLHANTSVFQTLISDALTRKFNIRMMGTGVGRFALEIQHAGLNALIEKNIKYALKCSQITDLLKRLYQIDMPQPEVMYGTATNISLPDESIDTILTSPPYLPASSGREDYLIGKSISLTALGLMDEIEIRHAETRSVGSMTNPNSAFNGLPATVYEVYHWLCADSLRQIKAAPTLAYYQEMKLALRESHRVLKTGGKAIYIIGKESVFYSFKTREILYKVECDKIFREIAQSAGFNIEAMIDIELNKKNKNARPRSLDKFHETAIILKK